MSAESITRTRRAAYSVSETAKLCSISRARFYDLVKSGVMPSPVYCTRTRRPFYTADLAALCVRVRETNTDIDGRYVIFYSRRTETPPVAPSSRPRLMTHPAPDPLTHEMIETLRSMGVRSGEQDIRDAILQQCPHGVVETAFETDLRAVFDRLRCRDVG